AFLVPPGGSRPGGESSRERGHGDPRLTLGDLSQALIDLGLLPGFDSRPIRDPRTRTRTGRRRSWLRGGGPAWPPAALPPPWTRKKLDQTSSRDPGQRIGISRIRTPVAEKTAFAMAGATAMTGVSPAPTEGRSGRSRRWI